jgi:hypothetical protein
VTALSFCTAKSLHKLCVTTLSHKLGMLCHGVLIQKGRQKVKAVTEKHMVVVTALALELIIFWLIASDPRTPTAASSLTPSPSSTIDSAPDIDVIATVTATQSSD